MKSTKQVPLQKIGKYTSAKQLGHGSYGTVYLVENYIKQRYAARVFITKDKKKTTYEANLLLQVRHSNIVKILGFIVFAGEQYFGIIMDYCPGGTLRELIGIKDEGKIKKMMIEIAEGLRYLHQKNIIHRDLKPENIFVGEGGTLKIGDFGIAKMMEKDFTQTFRQATPFYRDQLILYTDPKYGKQIDIWSLGIIFIEIVSGQRIQNMTRGKIPAEIQKFSSTIKPYIKSKKYLELLQGMLQENIEKRYKITQVLQGLRVEVQLEQISNTNKVLLKKHSDCTYTGGIIDNRREGFEKYGHVFEGEFKNNIKRGKGVYKYKNGDLYEGESKATRYHSLGYEKLNHKFHSETYSGELQNGKRNDQQKVQLSNWYSYQGECQNGQFHGRGIQKFPNGRVFKGQFKHSQSENQESLKYPKQLSGYKADYKGEWRNGFETLNVKGDSYEGGFLRNKMHCNGILKIHGEQDNVKYGYNSQLTNREIYQRNAQINQHPQNGSFFNDQFFKHQNLFKIQKAQDQKTQDNEEIVQQAQLLSENCDKIKDDQIAGEQITQFQIGNTYEGEILNNLKHGQGVLRSKQNGKIIFCGEFKNEVRQGQGKFEFENGDVYEGEWKNDLMDGFGSIKYKNGDLYNGHMKNGKINGYGCIYYQNGNLYSGNFVDNQLHGQGIFIEKGKRFKVTYEFGERKEMIQF